MIYFTLDVINNLSFLRYIYIDELDTLNLHKDIFTNVMF